MNVWAFVGVLSGVIIGIVITRALLKLGNKGKSKTEYDERQMVGRRKGYTAGFVAMSISLGVLAVLSIGEIEIPVHPSVLYFGAIFVGVIAAVSVFIFTDSYWGLNNSKTRYAVIFIIVGLVNVAVPIINLVDGRLFVEGKLGMSGCNLLVGVMFIIIAVELIVKKIIDGKGGDEE